MFENNGYGEGTAAGYAVGSKDIASRAAAFGMPALKVDGADIFAVYDTCQKAVKHCRAGKGPITIEASITRFRGHFEGDAQAYRGKDEVKRLMRDLDCLKIASDNAIKKKLVTKAQLHKIDEEVAAYIDASAKAALAAPGPDVSELLTDVYSSAY
jgi:acetoin:2,6-dichlorophenolindophenol oxidoreductase subunit alpha